MANINVKTIFDSLRTEYYSKLISNLSSGGTDFFSLMRTKRKPKKTLPLVMKWNGKYYRGDARFDAIRNHLASCFKDTDYTFSKNTADIHDRVTSIFNTFYTSLHEDKWNDFFEFTLDEVYTAIMKLDDKKDSGPMKIQTTYIKFNVGIITPILTNIFNAILHTGIIPDDWKISYLTPIPKRGDLHDIANYRGIAMQSVVPKIFDMLLTARLYEHLEFAIPTNQHGFVKGRSTTSNLLEQTHQIMETIKAGGRMDVIYFDFSKAFDHVNHTKLFAKLSKLSIPLPLLKLVASFIVGRTYILKVDGITTTSSICPQSSVPQGSHIGPLLYIVFCHDLPECVNNTGALSLLYADDTKFAKQVSNDDHRRMLQLAIDNLSNWATSNELTLNTSKTQHVSYGKNTTDDQYSYYYLGTERIKRVSTARDLGVIFDEKATFIPHIDHLVSRITSMYGAAYRFAKEIKHFRMVMRIIQIYVQPIVEYASIVWDQDRIGHNTRLEKILHMASRTSLGAPFDVRHQSYINFNQRMAKLKALTFGARRVISSIITLIKIMRGTLASQSLTNIINECRHIPTRVLRSTTTFDQQKIRKLAIKHPIAITLLRFNKFQHLFSEDDSIKTIRKKLDEYLLKNNPEFED